MLEDLLKGRKIFEVTEEIRENVIKKLREILGKKKEIVLAIVFGSFVEYEKARDIDIAIYTIEKKDELESYIYADELAEELRKYLNKPIDIIVLNNVGEGILQRALKGIPIIVRNKRLYIGLKMLAIETKKAFKKFKMFESNKNKSESIVSR